VSPKSTFLSEMSLAIECESCGMPMSSKEEHGAQDPNNPYCIHCTDLDGKLLPFEKKYEDFVKIAMETRWMSREKAEKTALEEMSQMPAWRAKIQQAAKTG
jgi:hypothetical protein